VKCDVLYYKVFPIVPRSIGQNVHHQKWVLAFHSEHKKKYPTSMSKVLSNLGACIASRQKDGSIEIDDQR